MTDARWGADFDPDRLASLELRMWKAYYRRQGPRLFALLVRANHEQAGVGWLSAFRAAFYLARAAVGFGLTAYPDQAGVPYLRALLVHCGALPDLDRQLLDFEAWLTRRLHGLAESDRDAPACEPGGDRRAQQERVDVALARHRQL